MASLYIWHNKFHLRKVPLKVYPIYVRKVRCTKCHALFVHSFHRICIEWIWLDHTHFSFSRELNSRTCCCFAFNWRKRVLFHFISSIIWHSISCSVINPIISHNVLNSQFCFHFMCDELYNHDEVCPMVSCFPAHSVFYPRAECVSPQQNCQLFFTIIKQKTPHSWYDLHLFWAHFVFCFITTRLKNHFLPRVCFRLFSRLNFLFCDLSSRFCFCRCTFWYFIFYVWMNHRNDRLIMLEQLNWSWMMRFSMCVISVNCGPFQVKFR